LGVCYPPRLEKGSRGEIIKLKQARKWVIPTLLVAAAVLVCIRLGIWQLDRLAQRREFNSHYAAMMAMNPLELPAIGNLEGMEYREVVAEGFFDYSQQVAIRNQYYQGENGFHLLTPLVFSDGSAVLVDRGWIPYEGNSTRLDWDKYNNEGLVKIRGAIRLSREKADITGKSDPELLPGQHELLIWNFPNLPRIQLQTSYPLLPVYIQVLPVTAEESFPIAIRSEVEISEGPHLGYALQWFTFAGIFLIGYPFYIKKQTAIHK
jgi:surfeit locus 1 family protein